MKIEIPIDILSFGIKRNCKNMSNRPQCISHCISPASSQHNSVTKSFQLNNNNNDFIKSIIYFLNDNQLT